MSTRHPKLTLRENIAAKMIGMFGPPSHMLSPQMKADVEELIDDIAEYVVEEYMPARERDQAYADSLADTYLRKHEGPPR